MNYTIRLASRADFPRILEIYAQARQYMRDNGNPSQWKNTHPAEEILLEDIAGERLYVCAEGDEIVGVFAYILGVDPTYLVIEDGQWLNNEPYGVIHRIAVAKHQKGIAGLCFQWALTQCPNLRIDTHHDNLPMHAALRKNGFVRCGIIYLANGEARVAYHKIK